MGRVENAIRNVVYGAIGSMITTILGFISRTIFIKNLGVTYLGVNGLYTNILSVLSLAELGIGTAMNYSLYKPIAEHDMNKIKILMSLYKKVYRSIALAITLLGIMITPWIKYLVKEPGQITNKELVIYYLIFLFQTATTYLVSYKYSLSNGEQKNYIQSNIQAITSFVTVISQIIIIVCFKNFLLYLLVGLLVGVVQKIFVWLYFRKQYPYLLDKCEDRLTNEEKDIFKKNIIALLYHKLGDVSINQTDNILISTFVSITMVGILSNYNMMISTVVGFINIIFYSVISGFGNLIATEDREKHYFIFRVYRFLGFWLYGSVVLLFSVLLTPFITLWIGNHMRLDQVTLSLIMVDYYLKGHRTVLNNFKAAAGLFDADKNIAIAQALINLVVSILLVQWIGIQGVFIGTIVAGLVSNIGKPIVLYRILFRCNVKKYFKDSVRYFMVMGLTYLLLMPAKRILNASVTVFSFLKTTILVAILIQVIFFILFLNREELIYVLTLMCKITQEKKYLKLLSKIIQKFINICERKKKRNRTLCSHSKQPMLTDHMKYNVYGQLRTCTREQLLNYPVIGKKQFIRTSIIQLVTTGKYKKVDHYFWPNGLLALSLEWCHVISRDTEDIGYLQHYFDRWIRSGTKISQIDYAINGYVLIYLYQITKNKKYRIAVDKIMKFILAHPQDESGSLPYRRGAPEDIYVDSIGLICPFLCRYGKAFHEKDSIELGIRQIVNFLNNGFDSKTSLPYHGYNKKENIKYGIVGWGRAVGWLLIGLVDSLEFIPHSHPSLKFLTSEYQKLVERIVRYQKSEGYFTWQITAFEGHIDTSATGMICYSIRRGIMMGLLPDAYMQYCNFGYLALKKSIQNGKVLDSSAECMGFGMYPQTYGFYPWAQGPATALSALLQMDSDSNGKCYIRR